MNYNMFRFRNDPFFVTNEDIIDELLDKALEFPSSNHNSNNKRNQISLHSQDDDDDFMMPNSLLNLRSNLIVNDLNNEMHHLNISSSTSSKNSPIVKTSHFISVECSSGSNNQPRIYQAHHSLRSAGGLTEEQKAVRDSGSGEERIHIGRYMGNKGDIRERRRNIITGNADDNRELLGLTDEKEADEFQKIFQTKATKIWKNGKMISNEDHNSHNEQDPYHHHHHHPPPPLPPHPHLHRQKNHSIESSSNNRHHRASSSSKAMLALPSSSKQKLHERRKKRSLSRQKKS